jgi:ATP-dependent Clp protease protease subunit
MPHVIETIGRSKKTFTITDKLFEKDIITLFDDIDDDLAYTIITQLLYMDSLDSDEPIIMYINSPGGSVYAGLAIIDTMNLMRRKVTTIGMGICASMGASLLFAGTGARKALPNCRIMIHSVSSGSGRATVHDQIVDLEETKYLQEKLLRMISNYSQVITFDEIEALTQRDKYLSPEETIKLGLIDSIVVK